MTIFDRLDSTTASRIGLIRGDPARKAVGGPGVLAYNNGTLLSGLLDTPQRKAAAFLRAYRVGWFYKAEAKISSTIAGLSRTLSTEDDSGDNLDELTEQPLNVPFDTLNPAQQFLRLMERPNPNQTGRDLFAKTMIRLDMAGTAFWYLESPSLLTGIPSAIYGISPARMTASRNAAGQLIGWVLDADRPGGGVPFSANEILRFAYPSVDDDEWGQGVVEAVYAEVPLTERMAQHTADMLSTGGRLAGMMWPKERALSEDEFTDAQRAWRNVVSDQNAARRMLLFPEPMEYAAGASTPAEIGIPELAILNRDQILTAFPVNPYMVGVPLATGMNSGETMRYVRQEFYEGTIHPRVELLEEVIQTGLVTRIEQAMNMALDFDIEEPNLDDAGAIIEKAGALRSLVSLGFEEREAVSAVGLDHIKFNGIPVPEPTPAGADAAGGQTIVAQDTDQRDRSQVSQRLTKAQDTDPTAQRDALMLPIRGSLERTLVDFLAAQRERIIARIAETFPVSKAARKALPDDWWDPDVEEAELRRAMNELYVSIGRAAGNLVANRLDRVVFPGQIEAITDAILQDSGASITSILDTTRTAVADALTEGVRRGYSLNQIIDGVPAEGFGGIRNVTLANGIPAFDEYRAEMIARTETAQAFNLANLTGYREFNVSQVQAIDGDTDADCAARNGRTYSLDDAFGIGDHPNGTLDWVPVTKSAKSAPEGREVTFTIEAPVVHPTPVTVTPTPVTVAAPDLGPIAAALMALADAQKTLAADVAALKAPKTTRRTVKRDRAGLITSIDETTLD